MFRKHHLHLHVIFIHEKNIVYTYLFLIMLITLITSGSLKGAFVLNANDMHIKVMFIWTFWYLISIFLCSYELVMNFQTFGPTVKGHSRDHDGKSKGKTEQARKVRAKPMGRNQLGVKMQLSLFIFLDYKYSYLSSILHLYHHLFAKLVHLYNLPLYWWVEDTRDSLLFACRVI